MLIIIMVNFFSTLDVHGVNDNVYRPITAIKQMRCRMLFEQRHRHQDIYQAIYNDTDS